MAATTASGSSEAVLHVVFVDGADHAFNLGPFPFVPSLGLGAFKATISQRIGVSPRQISLSLARLSAPPAPDVHRLIAIDDRADFHAIALERDCVVLASLCRTSNARRGKRRPRTRGSSSSLVEGGSIGESGASAPETRIQRRQGGSADWSNHDDPANDGMAAQVLGSQYVVKEPRLRQMASRFVAEYYGPPLSRPPAPSACGECDAAAAEGRTPEFHCCVHDTIVVGFTRWMPPIKRPGSSGAGGAALTANPIPQATTPNKIVF